MTYQLLMGGYRSNVLVTTFDPSKATIKVDSETPAPESPSWIDPSQARRNLITSKGSQALYGVSEVDKGMAFGMEVHGEKVEIVGQRETYGTPAHLHCMKDGSGVVATNYSGGTALYFSVNTTTHELSLDSKDEPLAFPYVYEGKTPPDSERQDSSHPHQSGFSLIRAGGKLIQELLVAIEGPTGTLYIPDLGCDRVWVVQRHGATGLKIEGYLQCPDGAGPRHGLISGDEKHLYVVTELQQTLLGFTLGPTAADTHPMPSFTTSIAPPSVPEKYHKYLGAAELVRHPHHHHTLYASNRLELHIKEKDSSYPNEPPKGDSVAIVTLKSDGKGVDKVDWVVTGCDHIRGMVPSPDGKYVVIAGKDAGGVEIYEVGGKRGEEWKLAAKDETLKSVTTFVWL